MSIMIVDDERDVRESLSGVLKNAGYDVITAANSAEALEQLDKGNVHMMLVDMVMPGMSGEDLLMSLEQDKKRPPSIVITSLAPWRMVDLLRLGIGYIRKPINNELLLTAVQTTLGR